MSGSLGWTVLGVCTALAGCALANPAGQGRVAGKQLKLYDKVLEPTPGHTWPVN